jgi:hypothetical protein
LWRFRTFDNLAKAKPMPPQTEPGENTPSAREADLTDSRLSRLQEQEQLWFSWVTVLHERLSKVPASEGVAAEGRKVLEIARSRWLEAREALRQHQNEH